MQPAVAYLRVSKPAQAESLRDVVAPLAGQSTRQIARVLNDRGIKPARGGQWRPMTVSRLLDRLGL